MASLYDIFSAFKSELEAGTSVSADSIVRDDPEKAASEPAIAFEAFPTSVEYNAVGHGPDEIIRDNAGDVVDYEYDEFVEVRFDTHVITDDDTELGSIYEAIRSTFRPYEEPDWKPPHQLQRDVEDVSVDDSSPSNVRDFRGRSLNVFVTFHRTESRWPNTNPDNIDQVNHDVDGDGSTDFTTN